MKSNTKIEKQLKKKTNPELVETIILAKKNKNWKEVAEILSGPRKNRKNFNLEYLDKVVKDGEKVLVVGKVLSQGDLNKKIKIVAQGFSNSAKEKLINAGCEVLNIVEEIKKNPEMKGLRVLK